MMKRTLTILGLALGALLQAASLPVSFNSATHKIAAPLDLWTVNSAEIYAGIGLGSLSLQSAANVSITGGAISGITDLAITDGGTGASTAGAALTNFGVSGYIQSLFDDLDAATARATLGLGTLATQSGTFSGTSSGTNTGDQTSVTGNAGTATALQTGRTINGTTFDGTANITVTAAAGTLTGGTLASGVTASSLTSFGSSPTITGPTITGQMLAAAGNAAAPSISFSADTNTGIYRSGSDTINFAAGGANIANVNQYGIGIGTVASSSYPLYLSGNTDSAHAVRLSNSSDGSSAHAGFFGYSDAGYAGLYAYSTAGGSIGYLRVNGLTNGLRFFTSDAAPWTWWTSSSEKLRLHPSGGFSIGNTTDPGAGALSIGAGPVVLNGATANRLDLRNSTSAQQFRAYNTFTDTSHGEWGVFDWTTTANTLTVGTAKNGTGSTRGINVQVGGTTAATVSTTGSFGTAFGRTVKFTSDTSTSITLDSTHHFVRLNNASTVTVNLPAVASNSGREYWIKNLGAGNVTIDPDSSEQIRDTTSDASTLTLTAGGTCHVVCDGTRWEKF